MSTPAGEEQYESYVGRIARGAGISTFGQGVGRLLNYGTQVALARMYGPALLGVYVLGITVIQIANVLAQFGMGSGVVRYVAHYRAQGDVARVRGTILLVLWTAFALGTVLAVLMFFSADLLANRVFKQPSSEVVFRAFSVSLPLLTVMSMALAATQGFQTVKYHTYVQEIQRPLLNLVFLIIFYLLGAQILGAVVAYMLSTAVGVVLAFRYLRRTFPLLLDRNTPPKFEPRALFSASAPMVVANFAQNMGSWIVIIVLGAFAAGQSVGVFNAAVRTAALSTLVLGAFANIFSPMVSSLYSRGQLEDMGALYHDVSRWVFTGSLAIFLITVLLAKDIMAVFGPEFVGGWLVMIIVATGQLFNSSTGPGGRVLAMTGHQRIVMLTTLGSSATSLVLSLTLIPRYGIIGAGVAAATGLTLSNSIGLFFLRRLVGVWPYDRRHLKPLAAGLLAVAGTYLMKLMLPLPAGVLTILVVAPLFLACFVALVLTLGLSQSDRQLLAAFSTAVRRKVPRGSNRAEESLNIRRGQSPNEPPDQTHNFRTEEKSSEDDS